MQRTFQHIFITLALIFAFAMPGRADQRLFQISKSSNRNVVYYDARTKGASLDTADPIHAYWHNNEDRPGAEDELSALQRRMAYGYKCTRRATDDYTVTLTACNKRSLRVCKRGGKWVAIVRINGVECALSEIYVQMKGKMSVSYIELRGTALNGGARQKEIINN